MAGVVGMRNRDICNLNLTMQGVEKMSEFYITLGVLAYLIVGCWVADKFISIMDEGAPSETPLGIRGACVVLWAFGVALSPLWIIGLLCKCMHGRRK